jgi:hypothetical protein
MGFPTIFGQISQGRFLRLQLLFAAFSRGRGEGGAEKRLLRECGSVLGKTADLLFLRFFFFSFEMF